MRRTRAQRRRLCGPSPPRSERPSTIDNHSAPTHPPRHGTLHIKPSPADIAVTALANPLSPTHACRRATSSLPLCLLPHSCLRDVNILSSRLNDRIAPKAPLPGLLRLLLPVGQCRKHKTTLPRPIHGHHQVTCNPTYKTSPQADDPPARGGASRATWPSKHLPANLPEPHRLMLAGTLDTTLSSRSLLRSLLMARLRQRSGPRPARTSGEGPLSTLKPDIGSLARLSVLEAWEK